MTKKLLLRWFLSIILTFTLLGQTLISGKAQSNDVVSFLTLGSKDTVLSGPSDSQEIAFRLPADWSMSSGSILHINLNAATGMTQSSNSGVVGFLEIYLNETWLTTVNLTVDGEYSVDVPIPENVWLTTRSNTVQRLRFFLRDALRCEMWMYASNTGGYIRGLSTVIRSSSYIDFGHSDKPVPTDLKSLPYPIFQNTFRPDRAAIVIPDQPSQGEMQAAMTVSAALGLLTDKKFDLQLLTLSQLNDAIIAGSNLVFVGTAVSFPQLADANLPAPYNGTSFDNVQLAADDGILQMVLSPQDPSKVWLLISGNSDAAIIKAAQAVGSNQIQPYGPENLAIIKNVKVNDKNNVKTDFTFTDLGYPLEQTFYGPYNDMGIWFNMPANQAADGAYFEMVFTHSSVLNFDESNVKVMINDNLVGGLRFSDRTTAVTRWKFNIPAAFLHPGRNLLLVEIFMSAPSPCIPLEELWYSIMPDSMLHLPTSESPANSTVSFDLSNYPSSNFSTINQTALLLPSKDSYTWSMASKLAFNLGRELGGNVNIDTYYADAIPDNVLTTKNLILVGHPSAMPVFTQLSSVMPAPFDQGNDIAREKDPQYAFSLTENVPVGYIQVFSSPWDPKLTVLTVTGNKDEGLGSAVTALLTSTIQKQMIGNFIVVLDDKVIVQRIDMATSSQTSPQVVLPGTQESGDNGQTGNSGNINVSLPLIVLIVVIVLVAIGVIVFFVMGREEEKGTVDSSESDVDKQKK